MQTNKIPAVVKDVWISIKGTSPNYGDEEGVELITEGRLFISGSRYMVEYDESHMTGMSGTRTSMSIDGDILTVMRRGNINSNFIFTRGQRQDSMYETDHGDMMMSVFTNKVDIDFNENGGEVKVEYQVDFENDTGRNYFNILVKEVKN